MGQIDALNCNKLKLGLGILDCEQQLGEFAMPILVKKGWNMPIADFEALDVDGFRQLVQTGVWIPIPGYREFTDNTPEPDVQTYSSGKKSVDRNSMPEYSWNYDKGYRFHAALYNLNSLDRYDVIIVDVNSTLILATDPAKTIVKGITAGMVNTATYKPKVGTTNASSVFMVQLTNVKQFNSYLTLYNADQSGVDFVDVLVPITSVTITGTASAAAGGSITVQVNGLNNTIYGIQGLQAADFRVVNATTNAVIAITGVTESTTVPGKYVLAVGVTSGTVEYVQLYDATVPVDVAYYEDINALYQGRSANITTTA